MKLLSVGRIVHGHGTGLLYRHHRGLRFRLRLEGMVPSGEGQSYTTWIKVRSHLLPLCSISVGSSGQRRIDIFVASELQAYLLRYPWVVVTRTDTRRLEEALEVGFREGTAPGYTGRPVLHGRMRPTADITR